MKAAKDVIPWKITDISIRPYDGFWSFNPSIHFDGERWICVLRCCDYAMPDGVTIRSKGPRTTGQQTKNAMVIFDPRTWSAIKIYKMQEKDGFARVATPHVGFEDMRLFKTDKGGLQGIAASLHLKRDRREPRAAESKAQHQPPEQVLLSFDANYDIVDARPIRGDGWSGTPQKNWVPFDHCAEPRFLYSIDKGSMFDDRGAVHGDEARVRPSINPRSSMIASISEPMMEADPAALVLAPQEQAQSAPIELIKAPARKPPPIRGGDVKIMRGGRMALDTITSRPSSRPPSQAARLTSYRTDGSTRIMGAGRTLPPKYPGLRGGTQLVRVADDAWLGIGHEMKFVSGKKFYWHRWYLVDSRGKMTSASESMKLVPNGIEFAAGMVIDGDRVVVSFGVDDMECKIGETRLSAVLEKLMPMAR
jgi:hypothetical protein